MTYDPPETAAADVEDEEDGEELADCRLPVLVVVVVVLVVLASRLDVLSDDDVAEVLASDVPDVLFDELLEALRVAALAGRALYSCWATAARAPVSPTAPAIIRLVADEASLRPDSRLLRAFFIVSAVSLAGARRL